MIQVTYQKRNGDIIQRLINTYTPYRIGETTRQGWKIIEKKYWYKGRFYSTSDYDMLLHKAFVRDKKILDFKKRINTLYKQLGYVMVLLILYRIMELLFVK